MVVWVTRDSIKLYLSDTEHEYCCVFCKDGCCRFKLNITLQEVWQSLILVLHSKYLNTLKPLSK